ncbi:MAG: putative glycoside hydrolase [Patescibacteria group bacterium]|nr:putative glycoside hydrolase [Patescibacteria group bacterium]
MIFFKKLKIKILLLIGILLMPFFVFYPVKLSQAQTYPALANYFLKWQVTNQDAYELAKWDVIILGAQTQYFNPEVFKIIRSKNPQAKILAYMPVQELNLTDQDLSSEISLGAFYQEVNQNNWWLYDPQGQHVTFWPGTWMINVTAQTRQNSQGQKWSDWLAGYVEQEIMATDYWDGVFFDNCFDGVQWLNQGNLDINNDGQKDNTSWLNNEWRQAMQNLLSQTRQKIGSDKIIMINSSNYYSQYINGRLLEGFPYGYNNTWENMLREYEYALENNQYQPVLIVNNGNTNNVGDLNNYQRMRYSLASTLLSDGYFSFDYGDQKHEQTWWYDEYNVFLDQPISKAYNINNEADTTLQPAVWRRDFKKGVVLVNSTDQKQKISLGEELEKIRGTQDLQINNGLRVYNTEIGPQDGLVLLRPIHEIIGQTFTNGSFARVFNFQGQQSRSSFFSYQSDFKGGTQVMLKDLDADGQVERLVAENNLIKIFDQDLNLINQFYPYGQNYTGQASFTAGDINGDGLDEIITGTAPGGGPHVRIFNHQGELINPGFFAYAENFRGGVNVATGDVDGDGLEEIITGVGYGGGPHIRIFNQNGTLESHFFAYAENFRGGVNLACGDINGDGLDEIITGAGPGGGPQIRIFDKQGNVKSQFFAYDENQRQGVKVIVDDLDEDGQAEIMAMSDNVFTTVMFKD